jgi:outer membrane protein TolC
MTSNQQVRFLGGGRLAASPPTYLLPTIINTKHCHSERSEESQMFSRSVVKNNIITKLFLASALAFSIPALQAQEILSLKKCIETGLEKTYSIRISRNEQKVAENNMTPGNAGILPTVDMNVGYSGSVNNTQQYPSDGSAVVNSQNLYNSTLQAGINLNWTVFDGSKMFVSYDKLREMNQMGELHTR